MHASVAPPLRLSDGDISKSCPRPISRRPNEYPAYADMEFSDSPEHIADLSARDAVILLPW